MWRENSDILSVSLELEKLVFRSNEPVNVNAIVNTKSSYAKIYYWFVDSKYKISNTKSSSEFIFKNSGDEVKTHTIAIKIRTCIYEARDSVIVSILPADVPVVEMKIIEPVMPVRDILLCKNSSSSLTSLKYRMEVIEDYDYDLSFKWYVNEEEKGSKKDFLFDVNDFSSGKYTLLGEAFNSVKAVYVSSKVFICDDVGVIIDGAINGVINSVYGEELTLSPTYLFDDSAVLSDLQYSWELSDGETSYSSNSENFSIPIDYLKPTSLKEYSVNLTFSGNVEKDSVQSSFERTNSVILRVSSQNRPVAFFVNGDKEFTYFDIANNLVSLSVNASDIDGDDLFFSWSLDGTEVDSGYWRDSVVFSDIAYTEASHTITVSVSDGKTEPVVIEDFISIKESDIAKVVKYDKKSSIDIDLDEGSQKELFFIFTNVNGEFEECGKSASSSSSVLNSAENRVTFKRGDNILPSRGPNSASSPNSVGDKKVLYINNYGDSEYNPYSYPSTLRLKRKSNVGNKEKILEIWVADDCWVDGGTKAKKIDGNMVLSLANRVLIDGENNDIFDYIHNLIGEEWGFIPYSTFPHIPVGDSNVLSVLLCDIYNDDKDYSSVGDGVVLGLFEQVDCWRTSPPYSFSNMRSDKTPFVNLDALIFAEDNGGAWDINDDAPSLIVSTMAHEFTHLVTYYQKDILRNMEGFLTEKWVNEMLAIMVEDIVAERLKIAGPRGVRYGVGNNYSGSGNFPIENGRPVLYNPFYKFPFYTNSYDWNNYKYKIYSSLYTYGAYLLRNYGYDQLVKNLVKNNLKGSEIIEYALLQGNFNKSFEESVRDMGVAYVLSDMSNLPDDCGYVFNRDEFISYGDFYNLGSIDFYKYRYNDGSQNIDGLNFDTEIDEDMSIAPFSNYIVKMQTDDTGKFQKSVNVSDDVRLTLVIK